MRVRACIVFSAILVAACTGRASPRQPGLATVTELARGFDASVQRDLARLRESTRAFHDLAAAQRAGYPTNVPPCIKDAAGGMGHHYFDRALYDSIVQLERPEMLLYAPQPGGRVKLVAVEYVVPYRVRPPTAAPPRLFQQDFRKHEQFQYWYLHVWAWERNPTGLFEDWNPAVTC